MPDDHDPPDHLRCGVVDVLIFSSLGYGRVWQPTFLRLEGGRLYCHEIHGGGVGIDDEISSDDGSDDGSRHGHHIQAPAPCSPAAVDEATVTSAPVPAEIAPAAGPPTASSAGRDEREDADSHGAASARSSPSHAPSHGGSGAASQATAPPPTPADLVVDLSCCFYRLPSINMASSSGQPV